MYMMKLTCNARPSYANYYLSRITNEIVRRSIKHCSFINCFPLIVHTKHVEEQTFRSPTEFRELNWLWKLKFYFCENCCRQSKKLGGNGLPASNLQVKADIHKYTSAMNSWMVSISYINDNYLIVFQETLAALL